MLIILSLYFQYVNKTCAWKKTKKKRKNQSFLISSFFSLSLSIDYSSVFLHTWLDYKSKSSQHQTIASSLIGMFFYFSFLSFRLSLFVDILLTRWLTWWSFFSFSSPVFLFLLFHHHRFCTLSLFDYINIVEIVVSSLFYFTRFSITMVLVGYHFDVYLFISFRIKKERQRIKETAADGNLVDWWSDRTLTSEDARWDNVKESLDVSVVVDGPSFSLSFPLFLLVLLSCEKCAHTHIHE